MNGKKVMIIDDAVSSGKTLNASWDFLESVGCKIAGCGVVMKQGSKWEAALGEERSKKVCWVFECPLLRRVEGGWDIKE